MLRILNLYFKNSNPPDFFDSLGYEPTWAGVVEALPSPLDLHALITPSEILHLTRSRLRRPNDRLILTVYEADGRLMWRITDRDTRVLDDPFLPPLSELRVDLSF